MSFLDCEIPEFIEFPPIRNEKGQIVKHIKLNFKNLLNNQKNTIEQLIENLSNSIREENVFTEIYSIKINILGIEEIDSKDKKNGLKYEILFQEIISETMKLLSCCNFIIKQTIYDPAIVLKIITYITYILRFMNEHKSYFQILNSQEKIIERCLLYMFSNFQISINNQIQFLTSQNMGILYNSNSFQTLPWYYGKIVQNNNTIQYLNGFLNRISLPEIPNLEIELQDKDVINNFLK